MYLHEFLFANKVQYAIKMELLPWLYDNKSVNHLQFVGKYSPFVMIWLLFLQEYKRNKVIFELFTKKIHNFFSH